MVLNLLKGQQIELGRLDSQVLVGLGWDPIENTNSGGFLGSIFSGGQKANIDCDVAVLMLDDHKRLRSKNDVIYFAHLASDCGGVVHTGDNLTGDGNGDDEQIIIHFNKIPQVIQTLVFVVNIYDCVRRKQDFGMIKNAYIRIRSMDGVEMATYNLSDDYSGKKSLVVATAERKDEEWIFTAIGEGSMATSLREVVRRYQ